MARVVSRRNLLGAAGVAGLTTATVGAAAAPAHAAEVAEAATPQDFGAVGDGVADDTAAIQKAIDAQKDAKQKIVYFPPGTYRITRSLVVPDVEGLGAGNFNRLLLVGAGTMGARISIIDVDFEGTGIEMGAPLAAVRGLAFVVAPSLADSTALRFARDAGATAANTDDMDATITECTFIEFHTAVRHVGRGMVFTNNLVAVGDVGLDISWPTAGVSGSNVHVLPYGMRKWLIEGNHFHSMGCAVQTTGADADQFRGAIIANNILDIGKRLFQGGIHDSTISGNVIENGANGAVIAVTSGGTNITVTGNVIGGAQPEGGARPPFGIEFSTAVNARNVTITGNSFNWITGSPVYFGAAASRVSVSSNSFDNWNLDGEERWAAIRVNGDVTECVVTGNILGENPFDAPPVRVIGTLSASTVSGNVFGGGDEVLYADAVGADCYVDRRSAGNAHELTAAKNGSTVVRATGAEYTVGSDAYGSFVVASDQADGAGPGVKGGIRVVPLNAGGSAATELLCSTDTTNGVAAMQVSINGLTPSADNIRDIGSASKRMRTVYAHTLELATVAAADLPEPSAGAVVLVRDDAGAASLALSDGKSWYRMAAGDKIS